ncbi:rhomboid family intramembrane serine protease [Asanoa ishikariensis]|nr:rhomboid family intramembrane serine protease [Asanoa ishikariensis]
MREASVGHQCPECVAEGRRTQRSARTAFGGSAAGRHGYVTIALISLNLLAALIGLAFYGLDTLIPRGGLFTGTTQLQAFGGVIGPSFQFPTNGGWVNYTGVYDGGYYRLITGVFLHYGIIHLLFNMWALWAVGRSLEAALGPIRYGALYLLAGIGGSVAALLADPNSLTAGASGALWGLFVAFFVVLRKLGRSTSSIVGLLVINLFITFTLPGISWAGHLGGGLAGGVVAAVLVYAPRANRTLIQVSGCILIFVALVGLTLSASSF